MRHLLFLLPLAACSGGGGAGTCKDADALDAGAAVATVDGAAWASTATWLWQGESLQINTATADGWFFTLVAQHLADGATVKAAADAGEFPVEIELFDGTDGGGWALAYPDAGDSFHTASAAGGTLSISSVADDELFACFAFAAGTEGGDTVEVEDGAVRAAPFSR